MRYVWEACDIHAGRRVQASNRTEIWMVGYDAREARTFALISLSDGMISQIGMTSDEMVSHLNESGMRPVDVRTDDVSKPSA